MEARQHYKTPDAMAAVVAVVLNRAKDPRWPDTPCKVIAEPGQFPWYTTVKRPATKGAPDEWAWKVAVDVAKDKHFGITSTHFHTVGKPQHWANAYKFDGIIGGNAFYTNNTKWK
jgi:spore germination cell wall hydrolase CwlJ-like protein